MDPRQSPSKHMYLPQPETQSKIPVFLYAYVSSSDSRFKAGPWTKLTVHG